MHNKHALIIKTLENKNEQKKKIRVTQIYMRYILPKHSYYIFFYITFNDYIVCYMNKLVFMTVVSHVSAISKKEPQSRARVIKIVNMTVLSFCWFIHSINMSWVLSLCQHCAGCWSPQWKRWTGLFLVRVAVVQLKSTHPTSLFPHSIWPPFHWEWTGGQEKEGHFWLLVLLFLVFIYIK